MRLRTASLAAAAALHAVQLVAQGAPATFTDTLAGVRYAVPAGYPRVPALGDSVAAIYRDEQGGTWLVVAALRGEEERPARIAALLQRLGRAALGPGGESAEWQLATGNAPDPSPAFYQHLETVGGGRGLNVSLRQLRAGGRDLLVGNAFSRAEPPAGGCGATMSFPANQAEARLVASLLGRPVPPAPELTGFGGPPPEPPPGGAPPRADPEAARVTAVYDAYAAALRENRGEAAAALVTPAVVAFYADLRTLALHGTPAQVRALPLMQRMLVLGLRHRVGAERLSAMTPRQLLAHTIQTDTRVGAGMTPGTPAVVGDEATVPLLSGGRPTGARMAFIRGDGGWRADLLPLMALAGCGVRAALRQRGIGRERDDEVILRGLQHSTGRAPGDDIWQPLVPAGPPPG
ncbi:MAG TPA: hypothetical protein VEX86_14095 [Longimicrobium sp.]|nr:hypothetical protein [Longimicrobium sp.]